MEPFIEELMSADDLFIIPNEYSTTEYLSENIKRTELEELIIKKKAFLDTLKDKSFNVIYHPISKKSCELLAHEVSLFVVELEKIFDEREVEKQNPELTLTKKLHSSKALDFIHTKPEISNKIPNTYLANVLGITPVSLNQIRKRIAKKRLRIIYPCFTSFIFISES